MKVAAVIGHDQLDGGAYSKTLKTNEFDLFLKFCEEYLQDILHVFTHEKGKGYGERQDLMKVRTSEYDLVLEFHFNSFNGEAEGVEALYYPSNENTRKISEKYCQLVHDSMGIKIRGAKPRGSGDGAGFLKKTRGWAIILEPFFGDNPEDCAKFDKEKYRDVIIELIAYAIKLKEG